MSTSIDYGTLAVGALIGIGCRKQIKAAAKVTASLAAALAGATAGAVEKAAEEMYGQSEKTDQSDQSEQPQGTNGNQEEKMVIKISPEELFEILKLQRELIRKLTENSPKSKVKTYR